MNRLFTFGCSFTRWNWPTWADILGHSFEVHQNWGRAGIGNRAIAERVAEAHVHNEFTKDDTVIVQWSSHLRNDYARTDCPEPDGGMWVTRGSPASMPNQEIYNEEWFKKFWDQKAYYIHTLNNIVLVQKLLESTGCKWYMTSMSDLIYVSFDDESTDASVEKYNAFELSPNLLGYKKHIWDDRPEHWLPPIIEEKWRTPELDWVFNIDDNKLKFLPWGQHRDKKFVEPHLTPKQHFNYLDRIEIDIPLNSEALTEVEEYENIYASCNGDWDQFVTAINSQPFVHFRGKYGT